MGVPTPGGAALAARRIPRGWLTGVMIAALPGPLIYWAYGLSLIHNPDELACLHYATDTSKMIQVTLFTLFPTALPYVHMSVRLGRRRYKSGLALAAAAGLVALLMSSIPGLSILIEGTPVWGISLAAGVYGSLIAFSQVVLVWLAIKTYHLMGREPGDFAKLGLSLIPTALYTVVFLVSFFVFGLCGMKM